MAKVKYTKPKVKRTMKRGLRPFPAPSLDRGFPQGEIDKMAKRLERILTDCRVLDEENQWIVSQALLAASFRESFREAQTNEEKNEITEEIKRHGAKGHSLGFSEFEIRTINRVILEKDRAGQLESLVVRLQLFLKKRRE